MLEQISQTVEFIQEKITVNPEFGINSVSTISGLLHKIAIKVSLPYSSLPGLTISTVKDHGDNLIFGNLGA